MFEFLKMPLLTEVENVEELHDKLAVLSRKELQQLSKEHGIKANQKTDALVKELCSVLGKQKLEEEKPEQDMEDEKTDTTPPSDAITTEEMQQEKEENHDVHEVEEKKSTVDEQPDESIQEEEKASIIDDVVSSTALGPVPVPTTTTADIIMTSSTAVQHGEKHQFKALYPSKIPKPPVLKQQEHQKPSEPSVKTTNTINNQIASKVKSHLMTKPLINSTTTSTKEPVQLRAPASKKPQNQTEEKKITISNRWKNVAPRVDCHRPIVVSAKSKSRLSLQCTTNVPQKKIPPTKVVLPAKRPKLNYKPYTGPVPNFSGESLFSPTKKRQKEDHGSSSSNLQDKENQLPSRRHSSRPLSTTS